MVSSQVNIKTSDLETFQATYEKRYVFLLSYEITSLFLYSNFLCVANIWKNQIVTAAVWVGGALKFDNRDNRQCASVEIKCDFLSIKLGW